MIIAIDGPAASGKGTLARKLAKELNYAYLDTGKLYRAVGLNVIRRGGDPEDIELAADVANMLNHNQLDDPELKGDIAAQAASKVGAIAEVRESLLAFQRNFATTPPEGKLGAILDGRDIGTVVCSKANVKLFISANVEVRAKRRHKELLDRQEPSIYQRVLTDLQERDERDSNRKTAPLKAADDAIIVDTSDMSALEVFNIALRAIAEKSQSD